MNARRNCGLSYLKSTGCGRPSKSGYLSPLSFLSKFKKNGVADSRKSGGKIKYLNYYGYTK